MLCRASVPKYTKYGALKVLEDKLIISFSNMKGLTCAATSLHLLAYSLMDSLLSFSIACKLNRSGPTSILNLYCLMKASTKSFHFLTYVLSNCIYQVRATSLKLSWKEMIQQFLIIYHLSHFVAVCFEISYRALNSRIFDKFWHFKLFGNDNVGHQTHLSSLYRNI